MRKKVKKKIGLSPVSSQLCCKWKLRYEAGVGRSNVLGMLNTQHRQWGTMSKWGAAVNVQGGVESNSTPSAFHPIGLIRHNGCPNLTGDTSVESRGAATRQMFIE